MIFKDWDWELSLIPYNLCVLMYIFRYTDYQSRVHPPLFLHHKPSLVDNNVILTSPFPLRLLHHKMALTYHINTNINKTPSPSSYKVGCYYKF